MVCPIFFQTIFAEPIHLEDVGDNPAVQFCLYPFFQFTEHTELDVLNIPAGETDEMVMMRRIQTEIIIQLPVRMADLRDDIAPG
jgi:hypothetical protein